MSAKSIIKTLSKKGSVHVGSGAYAIAMQAQDPKKIIKVGNNLNDPWLVFYNTIIKNNPNNPFLPQVDQLYVGETFYVAVMEKLEHDNTEEFRELIACISDFVRNYTSEEDLLDALYSLDNEFLVSSPDQLLHLCIKLKASTDFEYTHDADCERIGAKCWDLHSYNAMTRNGHLVIIDPWAEPTINEGNLMDEWVEKSLPAERM